MTSEQTVLNIIGNALWEPIPTKTDYRAQQLAFILGYPDGWRVVRTIETIEGTIKNKKKDHDNDTTTAVDLDTTKSSPEQEESNNNAKESTSTINVSTTTTVADVPISSASGIDKDIAMKEEEVAGPEVEDQDMTVEMEKTTGTTSSTTETDCDKKQKDAEHCSTSNQDSLGAIPKNVTSHDVENNDTTTEKDNEKIEPISVASGAMGEIADATTSSNALEQETTTTTSGFTEKKEDTDSIENLMSSSNDKVDGNDNKPPRKKIIIVDRIYAGKPGTECDMWFNHEDAMVVAATWIEAEAEAANDEGNNGNKKQIPKTPYDCKGGHLLPRIPKYDKNDKVQVYYRDDWYDAKILKSHENGQYGFMYQVHYTDNTKQSKVLEKLIRYRPNEPDALLVATELGFGTIGWKAFLLGNNNRYQFIHPDGTVYKTKKSAMDAYVQQLKECGDPPWRTTGSVLLNKQIKWMYTHKVSARRIVPIEQIGTIVGWISDTDIDSSGQPGFISDHTNKPAALYHVTFPDDPRHDYSSYLLTETDLEEHEILENLIVDDTNKNNDNNDKGKNKNNTVDDDDDDDDDENTPILQVVAAEKTKVEENVDNKDNDDDDDDDDQVILSTLKGKQSKTKKNVPTKSTQSSSKKKQRKT